MNRQPPEWQELQPLVPYAKAEPYPIDSLPCEIGEAVDEVQKYVKAPIALVATSALGVLSAAVQSLVDVKRDDRLTGPVSLSLLVIAESGERKSTVDKFFTDPIKAYQRETAERMRPRTEQAKAEIDAWEAKRCGIVDAIKAAAKSGKPTEQLEVQLCEHENNKPSMPRVPVLLRGDDTPESLAYDLIHRWPACAVISSEAGVVTGSAGMSKERVVRNLSLLNIIWDGGELPISRRASESFTVRGTRLTVSLQIQEAPLLDFFKQSGDLARGTGFLARYLPAIPESTQGQRKYTKPSKMVHLDRFSRRIRTLLDTPAPLRPDGTLDPTLLPLSPEAKAAWVEYHDTIEARIGLGGELVSIRDIASKSADNAARLAALFHVFQYGASGEIGIDSFQSARNVAMWHLKEALRFFQNMSLPPEISDAIALESWLLNHCRGTGQPKVPRREIQQFGPYRLRKKEVLSSALGVLQNHGRVRLITEGRQFNVEVHPLLLNDDTSGYV